MSRQSLAALVVLAALAAAIVIAGPCGDPIDAPRGPPAPPADLRSRTEGDRPVLAPPTDPLPSASSAAPLRAENSGSRTDDGAPSAPAATLFVRATDARGRPRARLEVEVRDRDPDLGPARLLAPPALTDAHGDVRFRREPSWPATVYVMPGLILEASSATAVGPEAAEPVRLATPDVGAVELSFLDDDGAPWRGPADVLLLVADADPSPDENVRRRRTARTVGGTARFEGVETGTLLLVEARPDDPRKLSAPLQVEGPSAEGATIRAVVRVTSRPPAAGGGAPRPRFVAPGLGPARVKPAPVGRGEGALLARCGPAAALPSWPYALEIGLAVAPDRAPETFSRCDEKGLARATLPAGRWWPRFRLWRAQPDGWLAVDVRSATPPPPITVEPGVERDASLTVDAAALEEAAAILAAP